MLITGAAGMVGRAIREHCEASGDTVFAFDRRALDIANTEDVLQAIGRTKPDAVINCAAWTDVDGCESDVGARICRKCSRPGKSRDRHRETNAAFVTISTDYVFDGTKEGLLHTGRSTESSKRLCARKTRG